MKKLFFLLIFASIALCLNAQTVDEKYWKDYKEQLEKTVVGMSLEDFKILWKGAKGPFSDFHDKDLIIYNFSKPPRPFSALGGVKILYFSFKDDKLIGWVEI